MKKIKYFVNEFLKFYQFFDAQENVLRASKHSSNVFIIKLKIFVVELLSKNCDNLEVLALNHILKLDLMALKSMQYFFCFLHFPRWLQIRKLLPFNRSF